MKIKINNLIKFYILFSLLKRPACGYNLMKELRDKLDRKISANQIYPFFNLLKKNKLVAIKQKGGRKKKIYSLTIKGKKFADEIVTKFGELVEIMLKPNLSTCVHCGCKIYKEYYKENINGKNMIFCCKHCAKSYKTRL